MKVCRKPDGQWAVENADGEVVGLYPSNAAAWRALDRLQNEPINKREDTADWAFRQSGPGIA